MIPRIREINFPSYATLHTATVTLNDMGDRAITAQVKIDGSVVPDFSFDWEVEFQGERYIHAIREPQASKGNDSICSVIDITFQHWTIYQLRRYFFVEMASTTAGTAIADKYIASLSGNLKAFCDAFQKVLDYYYNGEITIVLNPEWEYAEEASYVEISYTHIWDVLQKLYEAYGVRWTIEGTTIKVGYPTEEVAHTFEYGFEGGLLKVERQVQSTDIRNSLLGRGGEKNLPYRYFKDTDPDNPTFTADPDWIPELANIYFTELRGKTFRDYVQGWKTNPNRDLSYGDVVEAYDTERGDSEDGWAYKAGHTDSKFNPIESVEDKDSIAKYGLLQGGLENQEDIHPSIQGVEVDGLGRIDEVVDVEKVLVDPSDDPTSVQDMWFEVVAGQKINATIDTPNIYVERTLRSDDFSIPDGYNGRFVQSINVSATANVPISVVDYRIIRGADGEWTSYEYKSNERKWYDFECEVVAWSLFYSDSGVRITDITKIPSGRALYMECVVKFSGFPAVQDDVVRHPELGLPQGKIKTPASSYPITLSVSRVCDYAPFSGEILDNTTDGVTPITHTITVGAKQEGVVTMLSEEIEIPEDGATMIDSSVDIDAYFSGGNAADGFYTYERDVKVINLEDNEILSSVNIPQGKYKIQTKVTILNNAASSVIFDVKLLPTWIVFPSKSSSWIPTFDIWVKNIWDSTRNEGESDTDYAERVWRPILGDRQGNEAKVVFSSGMLSGRSDWEFTIVDFAYDNSAIHNGVQSEWRLTLEKSDAELESTGLYMPNATTGGNATAGDYFYFIGIDMPHQYVLWAEQTLDDFKRDQLLETASIKPTWVVQIDKVRLNQLQPSETEPLLNSLETGNTIKLADSRFISAPYELLYLQSITYTWGADTIMLPNIEVVLSDKVTTSLNPVAQIQGQVNALTKQVGSISNIQQIVRAMGDAIYLRKDGFEDISDSPTRFKKNVSSESFQQGMIGGRGWGVYFDENGNSIGEFDIVKSRKEFHVNNLVANQITSVGGKEVLSAARIEVSRVEDVDDGFKCYFDTHSFTIGNLFQMDDVAYSQMFDEQNLQIKYYKRRVVGVGVDYIVLSRDDVDGDGAPQKGDIVVHFGNYSDVNRQYVIIRDVIGGGYVRMLQGLDSVSAVGKEYYFAGRESKSTPRWFVGNNDAFAQYRDGVLKVKGQIEVGSKVGSGMTLISGGAIMSETITLKQDGGEDSAGVSGVGESDDSIRFWAGGVPQRWFAWSTPDDAQVYYSQILPSSYADSVAIYSKAGDETPLAHSTFDGTYMRIGLYAYEYTSTLDKFILSGDTTFSVTKKGELTAKNAKFENAQVEGVIDGKVRTTYVEWNAEMVSLENTEERNFQIYSGNAMMSLPDDDTYIGTELNFVLAKTISQNMTTKLALASRADGGGLYHPENTSDGSDGYAPATSINFEGAGYVRCVCAPPVNPIAQSHKCDWMIVIDTTLSKTFN